MLLIRPRNFLITLLLGLLASCMTTGNSFNAAGLSNITIGQTTIAQASDYLGAEPVDIWRQGDSTLARWAFRGTVATDAIYLRQELWLRFGANGTFENVVNTINIPALYHPKPRPLDPVILLND